jgi:hypothetical protein
MGKDVARLRKCPSLNMNSSQVFRNHDALIILCVPKMVGNEMALPHT